jgi:peptide/nickel transport system substrate-binding protein
MDQSEDRRITRRDALRVAGGAALTAGALAACGGSSGTTSPTGTTTTGATTTGAAATTGKRGGTLHHAVIGSTADVVDAHIGTANTGTSAQYAFQMYDGLTQFDHNYIPQLSMAESFEIAPDARSWTVRLKPGLEFHNGKSVTADDVIFSIQRIINPKNGASDAVQLASIDPKGLKKLDNLTVKINCLYPDVSLFDGFAKYASGIVPVGYDPKNPIGSGPFKYVSFSPLQRMVTTRFDNFWRKDANGVQLPYLDGVTFVAFTDQTAIGNALASSAVDSGAGLAPAQYDLAKANPNMNTLVPQGYGYTTITMRVDKDPFTDVRVRQAMKLMLDRQQFVNEVYAGKAKIANDIPAGQDPLYASNIPQTPQDIEKAKSLLKAAGHSALTATMIAYPETAYIEPQAQVFAQQARAIGANISVQQLDPSTFYAKDFLSTTLSLDFYFTATMWEALDYEFNTLKAPDNETHWSPPDFVNQIKKARGTIDLTKRKEVAAEFQQFMKVNDGVVITAFEGYPCALSKTFTGMVNDIANIGLNGSHLYTISLA